MTVAFGEGNYSFGNNESHENRRERLQLHVRNLIALNHNNYGWHFDFFSLFSFSVYYMSTIYLAEIK